MGTASVRGLHVRSDGVVAARRLQNVYARVSFAVQEQGAEQHTAAIRALLRLDGRTDIRPRAEAASPRADRPEAAPAERHPADSSAPDVE